MWARASAPGMTPQPGMTATSSAGALPPNAAGSNTWSVITRLTSTGCGWSFARPLSSSRARSHNHAPLPRSSARAAAAAASHCSLGRSGSMMWRRFSSAVRATWAPMTSLTGPRIDNHAIPSAAALTLIRRLATARRLRAAKTLGIQLRAGPSGGTSQRLVTHGRQLRRELLVHLAAVLHTQAGGLTHHEHRPTLTDLPTRQRGHRLGHLTHERLRDPDMLVRHRRGTPTRQSNVGAHTARVLTQRLTIHHRRRGQPGLRRSRRTLDRLQRVHGREALGLGQTFRLDLPEGGHDSANLSLRSRRCHCFPHASHRTPVRRHPGACPQPNSAVTQPDWRKRTPRHHRCRPPVERSLRPQLHSTRSH